MKNTKMWAIDHINQIMYGIAGLGLIGLVLEIVFIAMKLK